MYTYEGRQDYIFLILSDLCYQVNYLRKSKHMYLYAIFIVNMLTYL